MFYNTTHGKRVVYLVIMNPKCKGVVVRYSSHLFIMFMKNTKCPSVAALPVHVFSFINK